MEALEHPFGAVWRTVADIRHAAAEIQRIGDIKSVAREIPAAAMMFIDSFFQHESEDDHRGGNEKRYVVFMPGFFARREYYVRFAAYLKEHNIEVVVPKQLRRNMLPWREAHRMVSDTIKMVEDETQTLPIPIGHSKGGSDILGVLGEHQEIKSVICVGSPVRGSSLGALNMFLSWAYRDPGVPFHDGILSDPNILSKVTVITSAHDNVVPSHEAHLEGVRETIHLSEPQDRWNSHTGLPYFARESILRVIGENISQPSVA